MRKQRAKRQALSRLSQYMTKQSETVFQFGSSRRAIGERQLPPIDGLPELVGAMVYNHTAVPGARWCHTVGILMTI